MRDVYEYAKYFIKNGADTVPNTYDGNMKLQKLLVLSDFTSIVEYGEPLFQEQVLAFQNGCVVEKVRLRYKNDYHGFKQDSDVFQPAFTEQEYTILNMVMDLFGHASARELSEINHTFSFWKTAYENGTNDQGYHDKARSVVDMTANAEDVAQMREIIDAYKESCNDVSAREIINGIVFYYDGFQLTDEIIEQLERFSLKAEDDSYRVYLDDGKLVVF